MARCERPFQDCASLCDRCATPVYTLPPPLEPLRTKFLMICVMGAAIGIFVLIGLSGVVERYSDVNRQHQEDVQ